MILKVK